MPNKVLNPNSSGANEVSQLMYDMGAWVSMDWGCNASGADDDDMEPALHNLGYNSANQINYENTNNYDDVRDNLDEELPVLFSGCGKEFIMGIPRPVDCHAWVADGYLSGTLCPSGNTYLKFHMNWGWTNGSYNGYYSLSNFNPGNSDYDYKSKVIIDIEP